MAPCSEAWHWLLAALYFHNSHDHRRNRTAANPVRPSLAEKSKQNELHQGAVAPAVRYNHASTQSFCELLKQDAFLFHNCCKVDRDRCSVELPNSRSASGVLAQRQKRVVTNLESQRQSPRESSWNLKETPGQHKASSAQTRKKHRQAQQDKAARPCMAPSSQPPVATGANADADAELAASRARSHSQVDCAILQCWHKCFPFTRT